MASVDPVAVVTEANLAAFEQKLRLRYQIPGKVSGDDVQSSWSAAVSAYTAGSLATTRSRPKSAIGRASYVPLSARDRRAVTPSISSRGSFKKGMCAVTPSTSSRGGSSRPATGNRGHKGSEQPISNVDWSSFDRMAGRLHAKDLECQRLRERELQQRLKEDLDKQIADARLKEARSHIEDRCCDAQDVAFGSWEDSEREEKRKAKEKATAVQKDREAQVMSARTQRDAERHRTQMEADVMVERLKKENDEDINITAQRRQMRREIVQQALAESSADQARRDEEFRLRTLREDASLEEHYHKMGEREQRNRDEVSQKVTQRQALESVVASILIEKEKECQVEEKTKAAQAAKAAKDAAIEKANFEKMKEDKLVNQRHIFEQMQSKKEKKQKERDMKQTVNAEIAADVRKFKEAEISRMMSQRQRALENRAELERQMRSKVKTPRREDTMSASEVAMNRDLISRLAREDIECTSA